ncbi:MAG: hypothetical protein QM736_28450 [Vicinamibacterales bacterium]
MEHVAHQVGHRGVDGGEHLRQLWIRRGDDMRRDRLPDDVIAHRRPYAALSTTTPTALLPRDDVRAGGPAQTTSSRRSMQQWMLLVTT